MPASAGTRNASCAFAPSCAGTVSAAAWSSPAEFPARPPWLPPKPFKSWRRLEADVGSDTRHLMATSSFVDRLRGTGVLTSEVAARHGALGPVGRASGLEEDLRTARPYAAYGLIAVPEHRYRDSGDALARQLVRLEEIRGSFRLCRVALESLAGRPADGPWALPVAVADGTAWGWAEAPQGELLYMVETEGGRLRRVKPAVGLVPQPEHLPRGFRRGHLHRLRFHRGQFRPLHRRGGGLMPWVTRGLRNGVLTTRYPKRPDGYGANWRGAVTVLPEAAAGPPGADGLCPTGAISRGAGGSPALDRGKCILCGRCVTERPDLFGFDSSPECAALTRAGLVVPPAEESEAALATVRAELSRRARALKKSVHIRHVDAGSDGSEEWEIAALLGPVYDVHRLGVFFTASPRHADLLLVTGPGCAGMVGPLTTTYRAMPDPRVVVAVGTDAISGGIISPGHATRARRRGGRARGRLGARLPAQPVFHPARHPPGRGPPARKKAAKLRQVLLLAALALLGGAAAVSLVRGTGPRWSREAAYAAAAAASVLVTVVGALCVSGPALTVRLGDLLDFGQTTLRLDQLAGLFLTLTGSLGAVISLALLNWSAPAGPAGTGARAGGQAAGSRSVAPGYMLLLASVTVTIAAADAFTFLFAWEALTVSFYVLSAATRRRRDQPTDAWATAALGKAGGASLLVGFLLLAGTARSFGFAAWAGVPAGRPARHRLTPWSFSGSGPRWA